MKSPLVCLPLCMSLVSAYAADHTLPLDTEIANTLNSRYHDTSARCPNGTAAYECNGVLIRVADTLTVLPGELERNAASFSYLRVDTGIKKLYSNGAGIILAALPASSTTAFSVRCAFPTNAATQYRPDGCGETSWEIPGLEREWSRHCDEQGIADGETWLAHFNKIKRSYLYACAFRPSAEQFAWSVEFRKFLPDNFREDWNEVVTSAWTLADMDKVPFQAFFYNVADLQGRDQAKQLQREFYSETSVLLPIVRINLLASDQRIFDYDKKDQITIPIR